MRLLDTDPLDIDQLWISRLFLGALSEHEQRLLAIRLLRADPELRAAVAEALGSVEMPDRELAIAYAAALAEGEAVDETRARLLRRAVVHVGDLEPLARELTFGEVFELGRVARTFFSWSMAEHLLARACRTPHDAGQRREISLYLALAAIDGVELLAVVGQGTELPAVVADVRRRIRQTAESWEKQG